MIVSLLYQLFRRLLWVPAVLLRRDTSKDAELLVLRHENAVLRRQLPGRVRYEPADRLWLAALSALLPRRRWQHVFPVQPATILTWHRRVIAAKRDYTARRHPTGRPATHSAKKKMILRSANENPRWGHRRIQGELAQLWHHISASTVWTILHTAGVDPSPRRTSPTWKQFLASQARGIIAADFFHIDSARPTALRPGVPRTRHTTPAHHQRHRQPDPSLDGAQARNLAAQTSAPAWTRCDSCSVITPSTPPAANTGKLLRTHILGGLINDYRYAAWGLQR